MGVRFWARVEEPCKLDGFLCNVFEVADDILRPPVIVDQLDTRISGSRD